MGHERGRMGQDAAQGGRLSSREGAYGGDGGCRAVLMDGSLRVDRAVFIGARKKMCQLIIIGTITYLLSITNMTTDIN